jgi:hypothetical protein
MSGIVDPFNGHIDEFRIALVQRYDGWIETTWYIMTNRGASAAAGAEEQDGGEPPPLAGGAPVYSVPTGSSAGLATPDRPRREQCPQPTPNPRIVGASERHRWPPGCRDRAGGKHERQNGDLDQA